MDKKGMIFTLDSVLALIPIFIVMIALTNISNFESASYPHQINSIQNAQDILETMSNQNKLGNNILQNMAEILSKNNNNETGIKEAGKIAQYYLNNTVRNSKYSLIETNKLNRTITSNGDIKNANKISVSFKSCKNYIFKLCIWN